jgi:hypothetical protein
MLALSRTFARKAARVSSALSLFTKKTLLARLRTALVFSFRE